MDAARTHAVAERFVRSLETGDPCPGLFAPDVFCDFTPPQWRVQAQGVDAVVALRRRGHPGPGRVPRWRCDPTPEGFVIEFEERWSDGGRDWYSREMARAELDGEAIRELSVYCTGDWSAERCAQHRAAVALPRP
ncbi:MAG: hypothetical protein ACXWCO_12185 [Caldimonas sp.]